jgi:hypothetical protein
MQIISDNNFLRDSYNVRSERLAAIQGNFADIQTVLQAPAHIATWAATCFDKFCKLSEP